MGMQNDEYVVQKLSREKTGWWFQPYPSQKYESLVSWEYEIPN